MLCFISSAFVIVASRLFLAWIFSVDVIIVASVFARVPVYRPTGNGNPDL